MGTTNVFLSGGGHNCFSYGRWIKLLFTVCWGGNEKCFKSATVVLLYCKLQYCSICCFFAHCMLDRMVQKQNIFLKFSYLFSGRDLQDDNCNMTGSVPKDIKHIDIEVGGHCLSSIEEGLIQKKR